MTGVPDVIVRPVREADIDALCELVGSITSTLTSLPNNRAYLEGKVHESLRSFYPQVRRPGAEHYLFVLEDLRKQRLAGACALIARVGGFEPFYTYDVRRERLAHAALGIDEWVQVLHLKKSHKGPSELASLYLHPNYRGRSLGRLLSLSRFLFLGTFPERFASEVIAELRGWIDAGGSSPFWESVGRPFFKQDFFSADIMSGLGDKDFIEALMPKYPIYIPLLPEAARAVIGRVHEKTEPALHLLRSEGFALTDEVDIFDAGPIVSVPCEKIRTIASRKQLPIEGLLADDLPGEPFLLANNHLDFRATFGPVVETDSGAILAQRTAEILRMREGDLLTYVPFR